MSKPLKITILTLFPELFESLVSTSILGRAQVKGAVEYRIINIRDFGTGLHKVVDGRPYSGGAGMILKADVLVKAWQAAADLEKETPFTILMSASGTLFKQKNAKRLSKRPYLIIVCGRYEGIDQRFIDRYVDEEISIGDYVLTGGELPAAVVTDAIVRLLPGVLKKEEATVNESFSNNLLEYPQYTRPDEFEGQKVPEVLRSGNHQEIAKWQQKQSLAKTKRNRPDLLLDKTS